MYIEFDGLFIIREGFFIGFLFFQGIAKIIIGFGKIGFDFNSIFKNLLSFFILLEIDEYCSQVIISCGI